MISKISSGSLVLKYVTSAGNITLMVIKLEVLL